MNPLSYSRLRSSNEIRRYMDGRSRPLAGGTDLLPLIKTGIQEIGHLIDLKASDLPAGIARTNEGVSIGALTTLEEIKDNDLLQAEYTLLAEAAGLTATRQIRNRATLGGNLLQRPRCWYFRNPDFHCWLKGGDRCPAEAGCNSKHAIFQTSPCKAVHPSDLAGCLLALNATVVLWGSAGSRRLPIGDFLAPPFNMRRTETVIKSDELLTQVQLPPRSGWRSTYLKVMERKAWAFALAGLAAMVKSNAGRLADLRLVATGVANIPWRLGVIEQELKNTEGTAADIDRAFNKMARQAEPLAENAYKLDLLHGLLKKALAQLLRH